MVVDDGVLSVRVLWWWSEGVSVRGKGGGAGARTDSGIISLEREGKLADSSA